MLPMSGSLGGPGGDRSPFTLELRRLGYVSAIDAMAKHIVYLFKIKSHISCRENGDGLKHVAEGREHRRSFIAQQLDEIALLTV